MFWIHISSFAVYNALTGYLLLNAGLGALFLFAFAIAVHFVVNDYGLRRDHKGRYHRIGRCLITAGLVLGWAVGALTGIPEAAIAVLTALLAAGIIMNVLREELPEEGRWEGLCYGGKVAASSDD